MGTLVGKTALITGASRGIGRAIALRLAGEGALVGVHYGSNDAAAKQTVAEITEAGGRAFPVPADLADAEGVNRLWAGFDAGLAEGQADPGLDILVNNAGIGDFGTIESVTQEQYAREFAVNVRAPLFTVQQGLPRLRDHGRIINISSGVTRIAFPAKLAYSMTKGALNTFTLALAKELATRNITVNAVAPGIIDTDANRNWLGDEQGRAVAAAFSVFDRVGESAEVASVVAFVASPEASWITGQVIDATGGSQL